jgi:UDP-glucose 4-epimerase
MHYLITGGAGFIGSHLADSLLTAGHLVTVLDNLSTGKQENLAPAVKLIVNDICDSAAVAKAMDGCDGVFHLAAIASVTKSMEEWAHTHQVNQTGAVIVFDEAAKRNIPVVYASSAAVFGDNPNLPLTEKSETKPLSPYGLDKLLCEWQAAMGARCHGLKSVGLRFFNVYGTRQDPKSPYSGVISILMEKLKNKQPILIYGNGEQSRDFVHVFDVVKHLVASMRQLHLGNVSAEIFNVCTHKATSVKELASLLIQISNSGSDINHAQERIGDIKHSLGDNTKAKTELKIEATTTLEDGLTDTWKKF